MSVSIFGVYELVNSLRQIVSPVKSIAVATLSVAPNNLPLKLFGITLAIFLVPIGYNRMLYDI